MGSVAYLFNNLQSAVAPTLQTTAPTTNITNNGLTAINASAVLPPDSSRVSPLAKLLSELQQLQQSDPAKFQEVTQQIATNLQNAAQTAQSQGNTAAANQLSQLATVFSNASTSGQLPSSRDLAQALGGHHHHHHASSDAANSYGDGSSSTLTQRAPANQSQVASDNSLNPLSIIFNTLTNLGVSNDPVANGLR
jgi:hypothetical protein